MRVVVVNRFFYPDQSATSQMLSDLAFGLAGRGYEIWVVTSRLRYERGQTALPSKERIDGVDVERIWTSSFGRYSILGRALDYLTFYLSCSVALFRLVGPGDVVVVKTDPPMLSIIAGPIARWRGAKLVTWLQDIFPEVIGALRFGGRPMQAALGPLRALRDRSLLRAERHVVLGERMAAHVASLGVDPSRIRIIPNWADCTAIAPVSPRANTLRAAWGLEDAFVVSYSGNLGRAHEIETLLTAIKNTETAQQQSPAEALPVRWLFVGGGSQLQELRQRVGEEKFNSVVFKSYQPREQLSESLSVGDVHLVSLRPELEGLIVPSKIYGVTAVGRPAIFIGDRDGEIARLLERACCGVTVRQGDGEALTHAVLDLARDPQRCALMGSRARSLCVGEFDKSIAIEKWVKLLREVASRGEKPLE